MNLKDNIIKGQAFIGQDGNKYYYLGLDIDEQILFTTLNLWCNEEQLYMSNNNTFIKEILDEKSEIIEKATWYYLSMKEMEKSSMQEKVSRCLDIIKNSNISDIELRPTEIGPLVRGQVYSKEYNQYYEAIGFIVDNNIYLDNVLRFRQKGFFAIYHSNCEAPVPLIFERSIDETGNSFNGKCFISSTGDKINIVENLCDKEVVNLYMNNELIGRLEKI